MLLAILISSCSLIQMNETDILLSTEAKAVPSLTPFQPLVYKVYWSPAVPEEWIQQNADFQTTQNPDEAALSLSITKVNTEEKVYGAINRIFAIGVPFPTIADEISLSTINAIWEGNALADSEYSRLFITESTKRTFVELWGDPNKNSIYVVSKEELVTEVWKFKDALALIPFEDIEPKLKILRVDGISPLDRPMDIKNYMLSVTYSLTSKETIDTVVHNYINQILSTIPVTNRDESKMTVIVMTGTTAITRVTTRKIENYGYDYPVALVKDWFLSADLRHVSNEVSFGENCPDLSPVTMRFCSKVDQIKVLENLGVNIVESTGNHLNDYGTENFAKTLEMYRERGWLVFGGGVNQAVAQAPIRVEKHGNKIAFIGCNPVGFTSAWATADAPGAAECNLEYYNQQISQLKSEGYIVIATFQFQEIDAYMYDEFYRTDFKIAAQSGADIVQGSQAHIPMGFDFVGNSLIHYGLGNFIFDQMEPENIREFIDRHIIYDGKYINTELLTAKLVDWSRPTPMTEGERNELLNDIFKASKLR
ncbi:MAG: hypothetical protein FD147_207 [Chloroflexi bacterium]|nr:MAG: hypothetical protein FD147_207 [Chloroflexota bacterium]